MVAHAQEEARALGSDAVDVRHILLGLLGERDGIAARALDSAGVTEAAAREEAAQTGVTGPRADGSSALPFTESAKQVLAVGLREARRRADGRLGPEHLLLGVVGGEDRAGARLLGDLGADPEAVRAEVTWILALRPEAAPSPAEVPQLLRALDTAIQQLLAQHRLEAAGELRTKQRRITKLLREIREDLRALEPDE